MNAVTKPHNIPCEVDKPKNENLLDHLSKTAQPFEWETSTRASNVIKTPGVFCMMDLPTELRLKILNYVLVSPAENLIIDSAQKGACVLSDDPNFEPPSVAVLQTCKRINVEGTPVLYGRHIFTIYLPLDAQYNHRQSSAFFLGPMRWSTIASINTMYFMSNTPDLSHSDIHSRPRAVFSCTAAHLLSRYTATDFKYSPRGPDEYVVLSMSNYVSTQVMRAELSAFQTELEMMMRPSEDYMAALADDPAT